VKTMTGAGVEDIVVREGRLAAMLRQLLVIEVGTTNSRVYAVRGGKLAAQSQREVGARDSAVSNSNSCVRRAMREMVEEVLVECQISEDSIDKVFAIGMASSRLGLMHVPHCIAPAGVEEVARAVVTVQFPEIVRIPVHLVTGVRNAGQAGSLAALRSMDFMRSEETQIFGFLGLGMLEAPGLVLFLSSHTKVVSVDSEGRIE
jgi:2-dehydro-3-deoxygalactonokinase